MKKGRALADPPPEIMIIFPLRRSIMGCKTDAACIRHADQVDVSMVWFQSFALQERNGPTGPCTPAAAIRTSSPPKLIAQTVHRVRQFVGFAHIGAQTHGVAARLFDFQFCQVEFGLRARQQADLRARRGEPQGQALADAAAGARDQYTLAS